MTILGYRPRHLAGLATFYFASVVIALAVVWGGHWAFFGLGVVL